MSDKPILLLALGGTISMKPAETGGIVPALDGDALLKATPGLGKVARVVARSPFQLPGPSLTLEMVLSLAREIDEALTSDFAAAIIVQGTDTIEETAFVLDCVLKTQKPVVVTGAMRGAEAAGADGAANILASAIVATSPLYHAQGVVVVLNDEVHAARYVRKGHTGLTSAFVSSPLGPIGHVLEGAARRYASLSPALKLALPDMDALPPVALILTGMGDDGRLLEPLAELGFKGAVVAGLGAGHVPAPLAEKIGRLVEAMPVILASRIEEGPVFHATYGYPGSEIDLIARGAIPSGALGPAKARLLTQLLIANGMDREAIRAAFQAF